MMPADDFRLFVDGHRYAPSVGQAAVLGSPIEHSLSPALHLAAYRSLGLDHWRFHRWRVGGEGDPSLADALTRAMDLEAAEATPFRGFACTMPLKESALAAAEVVTDVAAELGAANTLVRVGQTWAATNTDVIGLVNALRAAGVDSAPTAVLLGSGATARAALAALHSLGLQRVTFAVRDRVRPETEELARRYGLEYGTVPLHDGLAVAEAIVGAPVTVATLPTGTRLDLPDPTGLKRPDPTRLVRESGLTDSLVDGPVLVDVVYGGWPTDLARWAQAGGATVLSGLPMLLHQAVAQVRLMTGLDPDVKAMREAMLAEAGHTD